MGVMVAFREEPSARAIKPEELMIAMGVSAAGTDPVAVRSVGELVDIVNQMNAAGYLPWYRGHKMAEWDILPSIWRRYTPIEGKYSEVP